MSAINSALAAVTATFNVVTAAAQAAESLARAGQIYASMGEAHATFCAAKQAKKNEMRLTKLDARVQREIEKEDSFL